MVIKMAENQLCFHGKQKFVYEVDCVFNSNVWMTLESSNYWQQICFSSKLQKYFIFNYATWHNSLF